MVKDFATKLLSLTFIVAGLVAAQSASPRKDIPSIARAANGSIVSIVMSDKEGKPLGQGSGFVVSTDGSIITNYHLIAEGVSAIAKFPDGAFYLIAGVVASDKDRDVAIVKAQGHNFRPLKLGNSDRVHVGEEVVAIGNPLSLQQAAAPQYLDDNGNPTAAPVQFESTVSNGTVSGVRSIKEEGGKYLQITAPISPASSGGPLFNMAGEVIGITTLHLKGGENLNFAIPINDAKRLLLSKSSTLREWPNEHESAKTDKLDHEGHATQAPTGNWFDQNGFGVGKTPAGASAESAEGTWPIGLGSVARSFYGQDYDAGAFTPEQFGTAPDGSKVSFGRMLNADFVCFSSDAHSDEFFTFQTWAYDKEYDDTLRWLSEHSSSEWEIWRQHLRTKLAIEDKERYLSFGTSIIADSMPSGGRLLKKDIYAKGVKIDTLEYHWDGSSWFLYPNLRYLVTIGATPPRSTDTQASKPRARYLSVELFSKPDDYDALTQVFRYVEADADRHVVASGFCERVTCSPRFPKCR